MMNYNTYGYTPRSPQEITAMINNQYAPLYNALQNQYNAMGHINNQVQNVNVVQRGEFVVVNDIKDVENYPAPIDGTPVLIFVNGKNVFYNKKFENGTTKCQPNIHSPYNNGEPITEKDVENNEQINNNDVIEMFSKINQRLDKLETKRTRTPKKVEVEEDGI